LDSIRPNPQAFITWAHRDPGWDEDTSRAWKEEVYAFCLELQGWGIRADVDLLHQAEPGIDWTRFGPHQIDTSEWVLATLSNAWRDRWEGSNDPTIGAGAAGEADSLHSLFARDQQSLRDKLVLVVLPSMGGKVTVPNGLDGFHRFALDDFSSAALEDLIRLLTHQPRYPGAKLAPVPELAPTQALSVLAAGSVASEPKAESSMEEAALKRLRHVEDQIGALKRALALSRPGDGQGGANSLATRARRQLSGALAGLEAERANPGSEIPRVTRRRGVHPEFRVFHDDWVNEVAFSPDGRWLATASRDNTARVWTGEKGEVHGRLPHGNSVSQVVFDISGHLLATASVDGTARVWNVSDATELGRLEHERLVILSVAFSPDGRLLASASPAGAVKFWDVSGGCEIPGFPKEEKGSAWALAFRPPDGQLLATASFDGVARLWTVATRTVKAPLSTKRTRGEKHTREIPPLTRLTFDPEGRFLATVANDHTVCVWDVDSTSVEAWIDHVDEVMDIAFSRDGRLLATACKDGTATVWDATSDAEPMSFTHDAPVRAVSFAPDGRVLATASEDRTARIWDLTTHREQRCLPHDDVVADVTFSCNGRIATASWDGSARVWSNEVASPPA
jgi:WD40 repeat protein